MEYKKVAKIAQIIGPVVDVAFDENSKLPDIYDALEVVNNEEPLSCWNASMILARIKFAPSPWIQLTDFAGGWM